MLTVVCDNISFEKYFNALKAAKETTKFNSKQRSKEFCKKIQDLPKFKNSKMKMLFSCYKVEFNEKLLFYFKAITIRNRI